MAERRAPYAPEYRCQMVCASLWCGQVARPGSWLARSCAVFAGRTASFARSAKF